MICSLCMSRPCDDGDSIGSRQGLCQDCWEAACSAEWWETVATLQELIPVEATGSDHDESMSLNQ